jgi:hypothetical protein
MLLSDASALVRGMAVWALRQLNIWIFYERRDRLLALETDPLVRIEWS